MITPVIYSIRTSAVSLWARFRPKCRLTEPIRTPRNIRIGRTHGSSTTRRSGRGRRAGVVRRSHCDAEKELPGRVFLAGQPQKVSRLIGFWHEQLTGDALLTGQSLNLDFRSVPYFGEHPVIESRYLAKRSRRQPSILTFLAQHADRQVFCYANADIRKDEGTEEIFRFIDFWTAHHRHSLAISRPARLKYAKRRRS